MSDFLKIDGSMGEGGGQVLRTSLGLSVVTGRPIVIDNIRANRKKPGLMRQHLACVKAAARVGAAETIGAEVGSTRIEFRPQAILAGHYEFAIGSAGSTNLVLQAILPALLSADGASSVVIKGGTHNPLAPCFDYLDRVFFRILRQMGVKIDAKLHNHGFFPIGGGCIEIHIDPPAALKPIELLDRGDLVKKSARVLLAGLERSIADREVTMIEQRMAWPLNSIQIESIDNCASPGNVVLLEVTHEHSRELIMDIGKRSKKAEHVARDACKAMRDYLKVSAPVGVHLADQLLIPMALAKGGSFRCVQTSLHTRTNADVIRLFLDVDFEFEELSARQALITVKA